MKKKKTIYGILCGAGVILIGVFANKLNTIYGAALFTIGVLSLVFLTIIFDK